MPLFCCVCGHVRVRGCWKKKVIKREKENVSGDGWTARDGEEWVGVVVPSGPSEWVEWWVQ